MNQMFSVQVSAGETLTRAMYNALRNEIRRVQNLTNAHSEDIQRAGTVSGGTTSTEDCLLLYLLIRHFNRKHVFEIGAYIGTSAVCMNEAVRKNDGILSTSDPVNYGAIPPYSGIRFMHGRSSNALQILHQERRQVDFCFMDWMPDAETLEYANKVFAPDTIIAVHDYNPNDKGEQIVSVLIESYCKTHPGVWFYPTGAPWRMADGNGINICTAFFVPYSLLKTEIALAR